MGLIGHCGLEFDYANEESFYCRPLRQENGERMPVPEAARDVRVAYLPPMSGLAANETRLDQGAINVRLGEGRTAEVLRNLCYRILEEEDGGARWQRLDERIEKLFGSHLDKPKYIPERGEISMTYRTHDGLRLDLSACGRGQQQTMLLLAHMAANPGSVLLLDEPDAHLEILRQRQIYQVLSETADETRSQIIAASHSEVMLNEAAGRDVLIAFVGKPHRLDNRGSQVAKALKDIGFEHYVQAEKTGWVLYLEGATDLAIFARPRPPPRSSGRVNSSKRPTCTTWPFSHPRRASTSMACAKRSRTSAASRSTIALIRRPRSIRFCPSSRGGSASWRTISAGATCCWTSRTAKACVMGEHCSPPYGGHTCRSASTRSSVRSKRWADHRHGVPTSRPATTSSTGFSSVSTSKRIRRP